MNDVSQGAQHVVSRLMRESLVDKQVIAGTEAPVRAILPNLNVIQIGGLSIMDRGHTALLPLLDEIVANQDEIHPGDRRRPGRARAAYPLGRARSRPADRRARHARGEVLGAERLHGVVPAREPRLRLSRGAVHRAAAARDAGGGARRGVQRHSAVRSVGASAGASAKFRRTAAMPAPIWSARCSARARSSCLKDVDGVYDADPKANPGAKLISEISARGPAAHEARDLADRAGRARPASRAPSSRSSIRIVNGLVPGNLTRALAGEPVGTLIHA